MVPESFLLFILYNSESALERAIRLFPFRTGVPGPDWIVTGQKMDDFAAGGIEAAGYDINLNVYRVSFFDLFPQNVGKKLDFQ